MQAHPSLTTLSTLLAALHSNKWAQMVQLMVNCPYPLLQLWVRYMPESTITMRDEALKNIANTVKTDLQPLSWWARQLGYVSDGRKLEVEIGTMRVSSDIRVFGEYVSSRLAFES